MSGGGKLEKVSACFRMIAQSLREVKRGKACEECAFKKRTHPRCVSGYKTSPVMLSIPQREREESRTEMMTALSVIRE